MLNTISCRTIGDLDGGKAEQAIDAAIKRAVGDLLMRGHEDEKKRGVVIKLDLTIKDDTVAAQVFAEAKTPPLRSRPVVVHPKAESGGWFLEFEQDESEVANPDSR